MKRVIRKSVLSYIRTARAQTTLRVLTKSSLGMHSSPGTHSRTHTLHRHHAQHSLCIRRWHEYKNTGFQGHGLIQDKIFIIYLLDLSTEHNTSNFYDCFNLSRETNKIGIKKQSAEQ